MTFDELASLGLGDQLGIVLHLAVRTFALGPEHVPAVLVADVGHEHESRHVGFLGGSAAPRAYHLGEFCVHGTKGRQFIIRLLTARLLCLIVIRLYIKFIIAEFCYWGQGSAWVWWAEASEVYWALLGCDLVLA